MKRWLPVTRIVPCTTCFVDGEYEGRALVICWGSWVIEIQLARRAA